MRGILALVVASQGFWLLTHRHTFSKRNTTSPALFTSDMKDARWKMQNAKARSDLLLGSYPLTSQDPIDVKTKPG